MAVIFDKLLRRPLLHSHGDFVNVTGDTMTGDLIFPSNGFVMTDSNGNQWRVTITTDGAVRTAVLGYLLDEAGANLLDETGSAIEPEDGSVTTDYLYGEDLQPLYDESGVELLPE